MRGCIGNADRAARQPNRLINVDLLAFWGCPCRADFNDDGFLDFFD
jgi:hypothetical protein